MKKNIILFIFSFAAAVLSGCSQSADTPEQSRQPEDNGSWKTEGFAVTGELEEGQALWAGQFRLWEHNTGQTPEDGAEKLLREDCGVCGDLLWYLGVEKAYGTDSVFEADYVLEIYDTSREESVTKSVSREGLGLGEGLTLLSGMDMLDEEHYVFRWIRYGQDEDGLYYHLADGMVYTDLAGSAQCVDFRDIYLEKGIQQEELTTQPSIQYLDWRSDGKGNIGVTVLSEDNGFCFYLLSPDGESVLEYEGAGGQSLPGLLRTPEGELILSVYDDGKRAYEYLWADPASGELRSLAGMEISSPDILQMYGMLGDDLYYRSREGSADGIVRWNVRDGSRERIFDLQAAGIDRGYEILLALREGQTPVLCLVKSGEGKEKEWLAVLTKQKPEDREAVRVADLVTSGETKERVSACAVLASMESPDLRYEYEEASAQENRDRILAELSQGKGPELLFVRLEDLYLLEEKGLLLDIREVLPEGLLEEILPGALEIGTVGGKLMGVPAAVRADTLAAAADTWAEDTWRLEDMIGLMEEGKLTGAVRTTPFYMMGKYMKPSDTVLTILSYSLADSFLIDWEERKCHFDDERFVRLLELTSTDLSGVPADAEVWLNGGKDILEGFFTDAVDFIGFFEQMELEGGHIVGYPAGSSCGSYLKAEGGVLAVNAGIGQKEAASRFLEILLGKELQARLLPLCMSVRRLVPENYIVEGDAGKLFYMREDGQELMVFGDGGTALHRAAAFLESCTAAPRSYPQIMKIAAEELSAMYAGGKPPETVAESINSRVQLYLDEGK